MKTLKDLINETIKQSFVKEYQSGVKDSKALGVMIARYFEWDGIRILDSFQSALTDANFHSVSEKIDAIREEEDLVSEEVTS